jgi:hypothetical protein
MKLRKQRIAQLVPGNCSSADAVIVWLCWRLISCPVLWNTLGLLVMWLHNQADSWSVHFMLFTRETLNYERPFIGLWVRYRHSLVLSEIREWILKEGRKEPESNDRNHKNVIRNYQALKTLSLLELNRTYVCLYCCMLLFYLAFYMCVKFSVSLEVKGATWRCLRTPWWGECLGLLKRK